MKVAALKFQQLLEDLKKSIVNFPDHDQPAAQTLHLQVQAGLFDLNTSKNKFANMVKYNVLKASRETAKIPGTCVLFIHF